MSINPYKDMSSLYNNSVIQQYSGKTISAGTSPHVYVRLSTENINLLQALAELSLSGIKREQRNQSVIIGYTATVLH